MIRGHWDLEIFLLGGAALFLTSVYLLDKYLPSKEDENQSEEVK